ncbi:hypothetical protein PENSTE_c012G07695 [Penicillium steckii]|uniref:Uncharacterized protein n=1 Tax=Penicillium steckii TaxID=303698 RepID=A0A1V6T493_9EURO|nr:hypothetical protein PENSTE_c012G07695 [Penicillium steckii]
MASVHAVKGAFFWDTTSNKRLYDGFPHMEYVCWGTDKPRKFSRPEGNKYCFPYIMEPPSYSRDPMYSFYSMLPLLVLRTAFPTVLATRRVPSSGARTTLELHDPATQYNTTTMKTVEDYPTGFKMITDAGYPRNPNVPGRMRAFRGSQTDRGPIPRQAELAPRGVFQFYTETPAFH